MQNLPGKPDQKDQSEQTVPQQPVSPVEQALARRLAAAAEIHQALREEHERISAKAHQAAADANRLTRELRASVVKTARDVEQDDRVQ
jgi:hypothetical protein